MLMIMKMISYLLFSFGLMVITGKAVEHNLWYLIPFFTMIVGFSMVVFRKDN